MLSARDAPAESCEPQSLPCEVWRRDQEPGNDVAAADLATQRCEEITVAMSTVCTEELHSNQVYGDWHHDKAKKYQAQKQSDFGFRLLFE